jgi:predicted dehydrogenase
MKIGIFGAGLVGNKRAQAIEMNGDNVDLEVVVDIDINKAKNLARKYGAKAYGNWSDAINGVELDAVIVATPNKFALPIALSAIKNKTAVLCEKPLGRNAKESSLIISAAKKNGVILKTGFNHRYHPGIAMAKSLVNRGEVGDIYYMKCVYGHGGRYGYEKEWRADKGLCGGGELLDQGVHVLDLFRWFLGEFDEVYGSTRTFYWNTEVEDNAFAMLRTRRGQIAIMHTSWTQWKNQFLFEVFGERGYLKVEGLGGSYGLEKLVIGRRKRTSANGEFKTGNKRQYLFGPPDEEVVEFPGPDISWVREWEEFISAIKENREPLGSGYDGLMANKLVGAIYRSAKTNRTVKISD